MDFSGRMTTRERWMNGRGFSSAAPFLVLLSVLLGGCATSQQAMDEDDPLQPMNRAIYDITDAVDKAILEPVAQTYADYTPELVSSSVTNFFDNLSYPSVILNDILQGKILQGFEDTGRFIVNSSFGMGGLFDFATGVGIVKHDEDFGQTLAVWGMSDGAYLFLPVYGPSSVRDAPGEFVDGLVNVLSLADAAFFWPLAVLEIIDTRANLLSATRQRDELALDPYIFTREAYREQRKYKIYDGDPPLDDYDTLNGK
jgi:phospholipid-binding lipoprotein MlaA